MPSPCGCKPDDASGFSLSTSVTDLVALAAISLIENPSINQRSTGTLGLAVFGNSPITCLGWTHSAL